MWNRYHHQIPDSNLIQVWFVDPGTPFPSLLEKVLSLGPRLAVVGCVKSSELLKTSIWAKQCAGWCERFVARVLAHSKKKEGEKSLEPSTTQVITCGWNHGCWSGRSCCHCPSLTWVTWRSSPTRSSHPWGSFPDYSSSACLRSVQAFRPSRRLARWTNQQWRPPLFVFWQAPSQSSC